MSARRDLLAAGGAAVATYAPRERGGLPLAHGLLPREGASADAVAEAAFQQLPGFLVSTDVEALGAALARRGARPRRTAELMTLELSALVPRGAAPPDGVRVAPFEGGVPPGLGAVEVAAFPTGHPDHDGATPAESERALRELVAGSARWTPAGASRVATRGGAPVGAGILAGLAEPPPHGGPWLAGLFRAPGPELRGLGAALLDEVLAAARADGLVTVGLAVTAGNPARALYASRGFVTFAPWTTWLLPGAPVRRAGP